MEEVVMKYQLKFSMTFQTQCMLLLLDRQELDEQAKHSTDHVNGVGFNKPDAPILTPIAEKMRRKKYVTPEDWAEVGRRLPKYLKQLKPLV